MTILSMMTLMACGGGEPAASCVAMLECDQAWAGVDSGRSAMWDGLDDPLYGKGGSCWKSDDAAASVCEAACADELTGYQSEISVLVDVGDLDATPAACE